jgi:hypothetical protein
VISRVVEYSRDYSIYALCELIRLSPAIGDIKGEALG